MKLIRRKRPSDDILPPAKHAPPTPPLPDGTIPTAGGCAGTTWKHQPCKIEPKPGSKFCVFHAPKP